MEPHEASAKERGEGVLFERVRRITGYLVGTLDRFNNAKRAEEGDRVKHGLDSPPRRTWRIAAEDCYRGSARRSLWQRTRKSARR